METGRRIHGLLVIACLALPLAGCGFYLYDKRLDTVAQEVKTQAQVMELITVMKTVRNHRDARLMRQIELIRSNKALQAELRLAAVVTGKEPLASSVWHAQEFTSRLEALGIKSTVTTNQVLRSLSNLRAAITKSDYRLQSRAKRVEVYLGIMPTPCLPDFAIPDLASDGKALLNAVPEGQWAVFQAVYNDYRDVCDRTQKEVAEVMVPFTHHQSQQSGLIYQTWKDWKDQEVQLEKLRAETRAKLVALRQAERDYDAAAAQGSGRAVMTDTQLASTTKALQGAIKALDVACSLGGSLALSHTSDTGLGEAQNPFSVVLACDTQREAIGQLIEAFATGQDPTAADAASQLKRATTVAAALPGLIKNTATVIEAGDRVPLSHLRLLKLQASLDLKYSQRIVERQVVRVRKAQEKWLATLAEADHLWQARNWLCDAAAIAADKKKSDEQIACETFEVIFRPSAVGDVAQAQSVAQTVQECRFNVGRWELETIEGTTLLLPQFRTTKTGQRLRAEQCLLARNYAEAIDDTVERSLQKAVAHYALAAQSAEAAYAEADYRMRASDGDIALDADERAIELWSQLIVVPVNSLSAHYAAGLKAESIVETIVHGAALGAIAVGVNR